MLTTIASIVSGVIGQIEAHGRVERGYLGISGQALTPTLAKALGMQAPTGVLVTAIDAQGPAVGALCIPSFDKIGFPPCSKWYTAITPAKNITENAAKIAQPCRVSFTIRPNV